MELIINLLCCYTITGQGVGVVAAIYYKDNISCRQVNHFKVQRSLKISELELNKLLF